MPLSTEQLTEFEQLLRGYFDPEEEDLPDPKYLHRWAVRHGEELLAELRKIPRTDECPSCQHPRCDSRCDLVALDTHQAPLPYVSGQNCPCCMFPNDGLNSV